MHSMSRLTPGWCSPANADSWLLPLVTRKVNCSNFTEKSKGEHLFDLLYAAACAGHLCRAYAVSAPLPLSFRTFTYARTVARASIDNGVRRRETRAANKLRTDRQAHTTVL